MSIPKISEQEIIEVLRERYKPLNVDEVIVAVFLKRHTKLFSQRDDISKGTLLLDFERAIRSAFQRDMWSMMDRGVIEKTTDYKIKLAEAFK